LKRNFFVGIPWRLWPLALPMKASLQKYSPPSLSRQSPGVQAIRLTAVFSTLSANAASTSRGKTPIPVIFRLTYSPRRGVSEAPSLETKNTRWATEVLVATRNRVGSKEPQATIRTIAMSIFMSALVSFMAFASFRLVSSSPLLLYWLCLLHFIYRKLCGVDNSRLNRGGVPKIATRRLQSKYLLLFFFARSREISGRMSTGACRAGNGIRSIVNRDGSLPPKIIQHSSFLKNRYSLAEINPSSSSRRDKL